MKDIVQLSKEAVDTFLSKAYNVLFKETVTLKMWTLLHKLMNDEHLKDFVLVGGTALSLRIGHRQSVDIDLFTTKDFNAKDLFAHLQNSFHAEGNQTSPKSIHTFINDIKVDIITHKFSVLEPVEVVENIRLISTENIGAMKLHAIMQSGTRLKDFVDMYFLLEKHPLKTYLDAYEKKYNGNSKLACYALGYYENIDMAQKIHIIKGKETNWNKMKLRLEKAVFNPVFKFGEGLNKPFDKRRGRGLR